jgi:peptide deformylase
MSIIKLVQLPHDEFKSVSTTLRKISEEVVIFDAFLQTVISDLIDTMMSQEIAVGLSAPQIGINIKVSVINLKQPDSETLILVNPKIVSTSGGKDVKKESCMSLPHFRGKVERRDRVVCSYQNEMGAERIIEASGFLARVICHEIDHLEGCLYIDRMKGSDILEPVEFFKKK